MDIEGLRVVSDPGQNGSVRMFVPAERRGRLKISLKVLPEGAAVAQLLDGSQQPGIEAGEVVAVANYSEEIGDRIVRAMAKMHLGLEEAATAYTAADADMIARGFGIGSTGTDGEKRPVWFANFGTHFLAVSSKIEGGLPALPSDPACLVFGVPDGRRVIVYAENLASVFRFIESGQLPNLLSTKGDVEVRGAYLREAVTIH